MIIKAKTKQLIQNALKEDIGSGDLTSIALLSKAKSAKYIIIAKKPCIICGISLAEACFDIIDKNIRFRPMVTDGTQAYKNKVIAHVQGNCKSILSAERTALNFLGWLSGIATMTNKFVNTVIEYKTEIMDTRKTTPTMRYLEKYAVKVGGGKNHRMGLYDQILIKENHISMFKEFKNPVKEAISRAKKHANKNIKIEIEVSNLEDLKQAMDCSVDIIMLDNMNISQIKEAVALRNKFRIKHQDIGFKTLIEVSGSVSIDNVAQIASCGVDRISIGALTHSAPASDFSLLQE